MIVAVVLAVCLAPSARAQSADPEQRLRALTGLERARALTELTDLRKNDQPRQAIDYGQEALRLFAATPDPANQVRTLNELAWSYMVLGQYDEAIAHAERGRQLAEQHGDRRGVARAVNNRGVVGQRRGEAATAVESFTQALAIYRELGTIPEVASALNNLGFVHATGLAEYDTALRYHLEALALREQLGDKASIALSLNNIGIIYGRLREYDRALSHFERSLALRRAEGAGARNRIAATLNNIGDVHLERGNLPSALEYHTEALQIRQAIGDRSGVAISHTNLGTIYTAMARHELAGRHLTESLAIADRQGDKGNAALALIALSRLNRARGAPRSAVAQATRARAIARTTGAPEVGRRALEELASAAEQAGDLRTALGAHKEFKKVSDEIFDAEKAKRLEILERRYQAERREREIERLQREQVATALETATQRSQRNAVGGAALLLGIVGLGFYRRRVESARLAEQLSVTDALTGLVNRRYVDRSIGADVAVSARRHRVGGAGAAAADLVCLLIDIDHFKAVNDEFGHEGGDRVLVQMGTVLREASRASDIVARWGGEEFLVVCRFIDRASATVLAERIRDSIERHLFDAAGGRTLRCTCSIGVAFYPADPSNPAGGTWEQVVGFADSALYRAKRAGRNRWEVHVAPAPAASASVAAAASVAVAAVPSPRR